ncbi:hypothetical protein FISHEDRAFT_74853 [Fistulina hepatica ATCC 64428]|uniref:Uncharacterized protein n=1 Tax=Fistulina hepatica ATCC 64428 TaxID=1128425 RepID=A0A0D7AA06_9AGAR|nr:hypothetical protein FISHEDRAFT_74853 [Fistulina hepatica ATCC 64428]
MNLFRQNNTTYFLYPGGLRDRKSISFDPLLAEIVSPRVFGPVAVPIISITYTYDPACLIMIARLPDGVMPYDPVKRFAYIFFLRSSVEIPAHFPIQLYERMTFETKGLTDCYFEFLQHAEAVQHIAFRSRCDDPLLAQASEEWGQVDSALLTGLSSRQD